MTANCPMTSGIFPGLSSPRKCQNKISGLSRFSRIWTNPGKIQQFMHQSHLKKLKLPLWSMRQSFIQRIFSCVKHAYNACFCLFLLKLKPVSDSPVVSQFFHLFDFLSSKSILLFHNLHKNSTTFKAWMETINFMTFSMTCTNPSSMTQRQLVERERR